MDDDLLSEAATELRDATDETDSDGIRERLLDRADALAELADGDRSPDHGRLAREDATLREIAGDADSDAVDERVQTARDKISEFRTDVEGV